MRHTILNIMSLRYCDEHEKGTLLSDLEKQKEHSDSAAGNINKAAGVRYENILYS